MPHSDEFDAPAMDADELDAPEFNPEIDNDGPLKDVEYSGNFATDAKRELTALDQAFRERAKKEQARREAATDSEYWVCLCFQTREQKEEFLAKAGIADGDKYVDGKSAAGKLGIAIESPDPDYGRIKLDRTWAEFPSI